MFILDKDVGRSMLSSFFRRNNVYSRSTIKGVAARPTWYEANLCRTGRCNGKPWIEIVWSEVAAVVYLQDSVL